MFTHESRPVSHGRRRVATTLALSATLVLSGALVDGASADTPAGWEDAPSVSALEFLLVIVIVPLGLAAVISLLAFLPTLAGDSGYQPGQSWRGEVEWFGGPRRGVAAADDVTPEQLEASSAESGSASGRW